MFSAIASSFDQWIEIGGKGSLLRRPTDLIVDGLKSLQIQVEGSRLPLRIKGPLRPGAYVVDGSQSSQFISGLLMALPMLAGDSTLEIQNPKSTPYLAMTLSAMERFGARVNHQEYHHFAITGGQRYHGTNIIVEADWSGLAFLLVAGTIAGDVRIESVRSESYQADRVIVDIIRQAGGRIEFVQGGITAKHSSLMGFTTDATDCPDLFPPLAVLATQCNGRSRIRGVHRLAHKESDRATVLIGELGKLGADLFIEGDDLVVDGPNQLPGGEVDAHGDHRIAMALACAGLVSDTPVVINGAEHIAKSYPDFFCDIRDVGGSVQGDESLFDRRGAQYFLENFAEHHE